MKFLFQCAGAAARCTGTSLVLATTRCLLPGETEIAHCPSERMIDDTLGPFKIYRALLYTVKYAEAAMFNIQQATENSVPSRTTHRSLIKTVTQVLCVQSRTMFTGQSYCTKIKQGICNAIIDESESFATFRLL